MINGLIFFALGLMVGLIVSGFSRLSRMRQIGSLLLEDGEEAVALRTEARASIEARTKRRLDRILARAVELGRITNDDVEDLFCISDRTATVYLNQLVAAGALTRAGQGRGTYYLPNRADL